MNNLAKARHWRLPNREHESPVVVGRHSSARRHATPPCFHRRQPAAPRRDPVVSPAPARVCELERTVACAAPARKLLLPVPSQETYGSRRMRAASDTTRPFSSGAVTPKLFDIRLILVPCRLQLQARRPSTCLSGYAHDGRIEKSQVRAIVWALKICREIFYCGVYQKVQNRAGPAAGAPRHGEARCPCVQIAMHCRACTPARLLWATGQVRK